MLAFNVKKIHKILVNKGHSWNNYILMNGDHHEFNHVIYPGMDPANIVGGGGSPGAGDVIFPGQVSIDSATWFSDIP